MLHLLEVAENFWVAGRLILQPCIAIIAHTAPFNLALRHLLSCDWWPQVSCMKPCLHDKSSQSLIYGIGQGYSSDMIDWAYRARRLL